MIKVCDFKKKVLLNNDIINEYDAGLVLKGSEVKTIRLFNSFDISKSFIKNVDEELWLLNYRIRNNNKNIRKIKLLLTKKEISEIKNSMFNSSLRILPTSVYWMNNMVKISISIAKPKIHSKKKYLFENYTI